MSAEDWLALVLAPGLGAARCDALLSHFNNDIAAVRRAGHSELARAGLTAPIITALQDPDPGSLAAAARWLEHPDHHLVHRGDSRYPALLRDSGHGPIALFVAGDPEVLGLPQLAIVGSRNATAGGLATAGEFAAHLARCGLTITSGLALGIDAAAHSGALAAGGLTVAVLGAGPDTIYPRSNLALAQQISTSGALVSEFPPGTPPRREQFPQRNRIIAALSLGTLVVEAGTQSGSLITARYAGDCGREVFAIPGSIHNPLSKGCHQLIRQGAKLVDTASDILEDIGSRARQQFDDSANVATNGRDPRTARPTTDLDADYVQLLEQLGFDPVSIDELAARSGLTAEQLSSMLLILELKGNVVALPGGRFQQCTHVDPAHE